LSPILGDLPVTVCEVEVCGSFSVDSGDMYFLNPSLVRFTPYNYPYLYIRPLHFLTVTSDHYSKRFWSSGWTRELQRHGERPRPLTVEFNWTSTVCAPFSAAFCARDSPTMGITQPLILSHPNLCNPALHLHCVPCLSLSL